MLICIDADDSAAGVETVKYFPPDQFAYELGKMQRSLDDALKAELQLDREIRDAIGAFEAVADGFKQHLQVLEPDLGNPYDRFEASMRACADLFSRAAAR